MLQNVGIGGIILSGDVVFAKNVLIDNLFTTWALTGNLYHAIPRHEYIFIFQISSLFFTTMLYKLLKREDQGLSPRKCCINILKRYYTAVQNRVLVHASTLAFICFI